MADYWVDDGGDGTAGTSWATAYTTLANLVTAVPAALTTSGNRIFIGHDTTQTQASALTVTGPTSGLPVILISANRADTGAVPAYLASTTNQIETTGANAITFDGSFALYGIKVVSGAGINLGNDSNESAYANGCTFAPGANERLYTSSAANGASAKLYNCTVDLTADGATPRANSVVACSNASSLAVFNMTFTGAGLTQRTGTIFGCGGQHDSLTVSSCDLSGFTNAGPCELMQNNVAGTAVFANCKTVASVAFLNAAPASASGEAYFYNVGPADAPTSVALISFFGSLISTASIYRTGGAAVEGDPCSWLITTTASCGEGAPFYTPWIYGTVNTTGAKTFDCYITNDTADFTDAQVWLEVEYLATADDAKWTLATDQRATITTTAAAQDDDTVSAWNGTGPSFTYKQKLSVPATIGETGQYRARVAVGVASIAGSRYFYVDPAIAVS